MYSPDLACHAHARTAVVKNIRVSACVSIPTLTPTPHRDHIWLAIPRIKHPIILAVAGGWVIGAAGRALLRFGAPRCSHLLAELPKPYVPVFKIQWLAAFRAFGETFTLLIAPLLSPTALQLTHTQPLLIGPFSARAAPLEHNAALLGALPALTFVA